MAKITYKEIELWIDNDESLYNWAYTWSKTNKNVPISKFIKENYNYLVDYIKKKAV